MGVDDAHEGLQRLLARIGLAISSAPAVRAASASSAAAAISSESRLVHCQCGRATLSGTPAGRVFTTNYDDGLERSARSRGVEAISLLPEDVESMQEPGERELQVIHLHGLPGTPESLVLPGRGMDELAKS